VVVGCIGLLKVEEVEYVDSGRVLVILVASVAVACIGPLKVKEVEYVDSGRVLVILLASVAVACIGPLKVEEVEYVDSGKVLVMFMQSSLNGGFRRGGRPYIYIYIYIYIGEKYQPFPSGVVSLRGIPNQVFYFFEVEHTSPFRLVWSPFG